MVRVGQHVARGELLGRLGSSGNSDAPHLHFQIMNRAFVLDTDGLPFVFERMELQGRIGNTLDGLGPLFDGQPALVDLSVVLSANFRSG